MTDTTLPLEEICRISDALHGKVQQFSEELFFRPQLFESLALEIAQFQAQAIPAFARLVRAKGVRLDSYHEIPAVPVEAFRLARVAAHPAEWDAVRFMTSGTTSGERGVHVMRRTDSYRKVALAWGKAALIPKGVERVKVVCLAPKPTVPSTSSLSFMMQAFVEEFDAPDARGAADPWLLSDDGVDLDGLRFHIQIAQREGFRVLLLATSFALVFLLDALREQSLELPSGSIVMQTGGFKGKTREIEPQELRAALAKAFGIAPSQIVSEYGMTELSSQLYEGTLPGGILNSRPGWYLPPPWLRVEALSPMELRPQPEGEIGLACFTDLANVDSAVRIVTLDRVRVIDGAVELLGRQMGATPRGCSLAIEELVGSAIL